MNEKYTPLVCGDMTNDHWLYYYHHLYIKLIKENDSFCVLFSLATTPEENFSLQKSSDSFRFLRPFTISSRSSSNIRFIFSLSSATSFFLFSLVLCTSPPQPNFLTSHLLLLQQLCTTDKSRRATPV